MALELVEAELSRVSGMGWAQRWRCTPDRSVVLTLRVLNDLWVVGLHDGRAGVGRAQIDSNDTKLESKGVSMYKKHRESQGFGLASETYEDMLRVV